MATGEITLIKAEVNTIDLGIPVSGVPLGAAVRVKLTGKPLTSVGDVPVLLTVAVTVTDPLGTTVLAYTDAGAAATDLLDTLTFTSGYFSVAQYGQYTIGAALYDATDPDTPLDTYSGTLLLTEEVPVPDTGITATISAILPLMIFMMMMGMMMPMMKGIAE